jgi:hypothetical protein
MLLARIERAGEDLGALKNALDEIADGIATVQAEEHASQIRAQWRQLIDMMASVVLEADDRFHG